MHRVLKRAYRAVVTAYPAVLLRRAVSFLSRSVGCRSFWGFLEGICLCSESTCIVKSEGDGAVNALCQNRDEVEDSSVVDERVNE